MSKIGLVKELFQFLRREKRWWLLPLVVIILLVGLLLVLAESTALAPFFYPLF